MKMIIEKSTGTPIRGILVGFIITVVLESSSGSTAITVSLVAAGLMTIPQAAGVILGANVGQTVVVVLLALVGSTGISISDLALPVIFVGVALMVFTKKQKSVTLGGVFTGFGLMFYGLDVMNSGLKDICALDSVQTFLAHVSNQPILGMFVGIGLTALVQSSTAIITILSNLYGASSIGLMGAIAVMIGANLGTTLTAVLSSLGSQSKAKKTAMIHVLLNVFGCILFMIMIYPFTLLVGLIEEYMVIPLMGQKGLPLTIALSHVVYNVLKVFIAYWFIKYIVKLADKIIRNDSESDIVKRIKNAPIQDPVLALESSKKDISYMCDLVINMANNFKSYINDSQMIYYDDTQKLENEVDQLDDLMHDYLIRVAQLDMNNEQSSKLAKYLDTIGDVERIGDHIVNLFDFFKERYENKALLSDDGKNGIETMSNEVFDMLDKTVLSFKEHNVELALDVIKIENSIDNLEQKYRKEHIVRVYEGKCKALLIDNYTDILSNLERIGDHCTNIAEKISTGINYFNE